MFKKSWNMIKDDFQRENHFKERKVTVSKEEEEEKQKWTLDIRSIEWYRLYNFLSSLDDFLVSLRRDLLRVIFSFRMNWIYYRSEWLFHWRQTNIVDVDEFSWQRDENTRSTFRSLIIYLYCVVEVNKDYRKNCRWNHAEHRTISNNHFAIIDRSKWNFHRNNEDPNQRKTEVRSSVCKVFTRIKNWLFERTARRHFEAASASPPIMIGEPNSRKCLERTSIYFTKSRPLEMCTILQST